MLERQVSEVWGEWVAGMGNWHVFGGLTYRQPVGTPRRGPEAVRKDVRDWLRYSNRQLSGRIEAGVLAVEHHKSGWPHVHPLLRLSGGVQTGDIVTLGEAWYERNGFAKLELPRSQEDVCAYAAKYLAKDLGTGDVLFWPLRGPLTVHQPRLGPAR